MFNCAIDHITVTAPALQSGADYVWQALGVELQAGGEHPRMGTHNLLLRLGDALFLEVIAVNPSATRPQRARWFELDEPAASVAPRLATWVARSDDVHAAAAAASEHLGSVETMTRGALEWLITIPADGHMPLAGLGPALIQWPPGVHPANNLKNAGCTLLSLEAHHAEPERVSRLLAGLGLEKAVQVKNAGTRAPHLVARINTPHGVRTIGGSDHL